MNSSMQLEDKPKDVYYYDRMAYRTKRAFLWEIERRMSVICGGLGRRFVLPGQWQNRSLVDMFGFAGTYYINMTMQRGKAKIATYVAQIDTTIPTGKKRLLLKPSQFADGKFNWAHAAISKNKMTMTEVNRRIDMDADIARYIRIWGVHQPDKKCSMCVGRPARCKFTHILIDGNVFNDYVAKCGDVGLENSGDFLDMLTENSIRVCQFCKQGYGYKYRDFGIIIPDKIN